MKVRKSPQVTGQISEFPKTRKTTAQTINDTTMIAVFKLLFWSFDVYLTSLFLGIKNLLNNIFFSSVSPYYAFHRLYG